MECVDIHVVFYLLHDRFGFAGSVAENELGARRHGLAGEPADHGFDVLLDLWWIVFFDDHIAARDVNFIGESDADRLRRVGFIFFAVGRVDGFDVCRKSGRQHRHAIARFEDTASDATGVATEVVPFVTHRTNHPLHREAGIDVIFFAADVDIFQMVEQRWALIPRHVR